MARKLKNICGKKKMFSPKWKKMHFEITLDFTFYIKF